jgi:succinate dehydrogenase / fumarate reductase membrane anchor subunit
MIVLLLGVHFVINHLVAPGGLLTYADVIAYYQVWFVPIMEAIFLVFVIAHALVGLRSIILDLNPSDGVLRLVNLGLTIIGIGFTAYGLWLLWAIVQRG